MQPVAFLAPRTAAAAAASLGGGRIGRADATNYTAHTARKRRAGCVGRGRARRTLSMHNGARDVAKAMSVLQLKAKMSAAGVSSAGIFEKSEMIARVTEILAAETASPPPSATAADQASTPTPNSPPDVPMAPLIRSKLGYDGSAYLLIEVAIKGHSMTFLVDTGASLSIITKETRDLLGFSPNEGSISVGSTAASGVERARVLTMSDVCIDSKRVPNFEAACTEFDTSSLPGLAGLLGLNFLVQFDLVVDTDKARAMWFYPRGSLASGRFSTTGMEKSRFSRTAGVGLMRVPAVLTRKGKVVQLDALFDLGAGDKILNPSGARALGYSEADLVPRDGSESAMSMDGTRIQGVRLGVDQLVIGGVSVGRTSMLVADMSIFSNPMIFGSDSGAPALIAGLSALENRVVAFDFKAQIIYLS